MNEYSIQYSDCVCFFLYVEITATKSEKFCKGGASRRNIFNITTKKTTQQ